MGIDGLLSLVKPVRKSIHIREYRGKTVAIDAMCWYSSFIYSSPIGFIEEHIAAPKSCV